MLAGGSIKGWMDPRGAPHGPRKSFKDVVSNQQRPFEHGARGGDGMASKMPHLGPCLAPSMTHWGPCRSARRSASAPGVHSGVGFPGPSHHMVQQKKKRRDTPPRGTLLLRGGFPGFPVQAERRTKGSSGRPCCWYCVDLGRSGHTGNKGGPSISWGFVVSVVGRPVPFQPGLAARGGPLLSFLGHLCCRLPR